MRHARLIALGLLALAPVLATAAPATQGKFIKYVQTIADMDRSYAFYKALGLEADGPAAAGKKTALNAMVVRLTGSPTETMTFRNAYLKVPGAAFQFEFTEFTGSPQQAVSPRLQDPGASLLVLKVRSADAALSAAMGAGARVVTLGGKPVVSGPERIRAVLVRDPEGYYVEFQEVAAPSPDAPAGNIIGGHFDSVVADAEQAGAFYHEHFGLDAQAQPPSRDAALLKVLGLKKGEFHRSTVTTAGSTIELTFISISGVDRKPVAPRIIDPGAPAFGFAVTDFDAAFEAYKAAGSKVATRDAPIRRPGGGSVSFVIDPFGLAVELQQPPSAPAAEPAVR
jgi:catechol 2,3-dioxygenase-like lactoylglutathione lyase family enzyme